MRADNKRLFLCGRWLEFAWEAFDRSAREKSLQHNGQSSGISWRWRRCAALRHRHHANEALTAKQNRMKHLWCAIISKERRRPYPPDTKMESGFVLKFHRLQIAQVSSIHFCTSLSGRFRNCRRVEQYENKIGKRALNQHRIMPIAHWISQYSI